MAELKNQLVKKDLTDKTAQKILSSSQSNELFVAIVGPAGAGAGTAAKILKILLSQLILLQKLLKQATLLR